jgi:hypothetical protein
VEDSGERSYRSSGRFKNSASASGKSSTQRIQTVSRECFSLNPCPQWGCSIYCLRQPCRKWCRRSWWRGEQPLPLLQSPDGRTVCHPISRAIAPRRYSSYSLVTLSLVSRLLRFPSCRPKCLYSLADGFRRRRGHLAATTATDGALDRLDGC